MPMEGSEPGPQTGLEGVVGSDIRPDVFGQFVLDRQAQVLLGAEMAVNEPVVDTRASRDVTDGNRRGAVPGEQLGGSLEDGGHDLVLPDGLVGGVFFLLHWDPWLFIRRLRRLRR
jgi:hypothetical protein